MELDLYVQFSIIIGSGLVLGLLSAIPVGAVQLEVVKKAINGHLTPAIAMAFGSVTSDFIYGILTLFSLGGFLLNRQFQIGTYVCGILVISFLFYRSLKEYRQGTHKMDSHLVYKKRLSYLTGFTIAITNPGMIIWWLIGFKIFIDITHFSTITTTMKLLFIISGCTGLGGYLIFIGIFFHRLQKSFSGKFIQKMDLFLMILLVSLIIYFTIKIISLVLNYNVNLP